MARGIARRGHPLLFLGALLLSWLGMRITLWEPPAEFGAAMNRLQERAAPFVAGPTGALARGAAVARKAVAGSPEEQQDGSDHGWRALVRPLPALLPGRLFRGTPALYSRTSAPAASSGAAAGANVDGGSLGTAGLAVGHALLTVAGLSQMQLPPALAALVERLERPLPPDRRRLVQGQQAPQPVAPALLAAGATPAPRRWSADGWLVLREGGTRASAAEQPSYGRSQAGAVLRYRLAPSSRHAPQAYARASTALREPRDAELAGGLSARPLPGLPLRLAAEMRVTDAQAGVDLRPAAYAVTEIPPLDLPLGARGEVYGQAGYVGGDFATPFVDGQVRVTRDVARVAGAALSAGAGVWGGAQEGAARLDLGPSAAVSFSLGQVYYRLSLDYRVRVAGDAEPRSGPALTLSAGF